MSEEEQMDEIFAYFNHDNIVGWYDYSIMLSLEHPTDESLSFEIKILNGIINHYFTKYRYLSI